MAKIHLVVGTTIERARQAAKQLNLPNIREMDDLFGPEIKACNEVAHLMIHNKIVENGLFLKSYRNNSHIDITIIGAMKNWDFQRTHQLRPESMHFMVQTMWVERFGGHDKSRFVCKKNRGKGHGEEIYLSSVYMLKERFGNWIRSLRKNKNA